MSRARRFASPFRVRAGGAGFFRDTLCRTSCVVASSVGRDVTAMVETRIADYVRYFERGRTEWLRAMGCSQAQLAKEQSVVFTIASLEIQYHRPARLDGARHLVRAW